MVLVNVFIKYLKSRKNLGKMCTQATDRGFSFFARDLLLGGEVMFGLDLCRINSNLARLFENNCVIE